MFFEKINVCEKDEKKSQYKSVYWNRERQKWHVLIKPKGQKLKTGGYFKDELDAVKRVNQLREELGIPLQNPETSAKPNQKYEVTYSEKMRTVKIYFPIFFSNEFFLNLKQLISFFK